MQAEDIRECVGIVAGHPVIGSRYGRIIERLPEAWLRLLKCDACVTQVFQSGEGLRGPICFFGVSAIVRDEFLHEMKRPPLFWVGPELTRRIVIGESHSHRQTTSRSKLARRIEPGRLGKLLSLRIRGSIELQM
jgi:hypothetical protein